MTRHVSRRAATVAAASLVAVLGAVAVVLLTSVPAETPQRNGARSTPAGEPPEDFRAFSDSSYWNTPLPADVPRDPRSDRVVRFLRETTERQGCVQLSGTRGSRWGMPVYWVREGAPEYDVRATGYALPPEFASLRIPRGAEPHDGWDKEMVVYDLERGYVAFLHRARYDPAEDAWAAGGGSIAYLDSKGLAGSVAGSVEPRNGGSHRGLNGAVVAYRYDAVRSGSIDHVVKIATRTAAGRHRWPMTGTDGTSTAPGAPVQGMRLRIRPEVDLSQYDLSPQARVMARALQRYGAIVGDSTTSRVELKLEDTVAEGRGQLWDVGQQALCSVPVDAFEVVDVPPPQG